jgi:hypothetical protein
VILPDFQLSSRADQRWKYSGIDSLALCRNQQYFLSYPYSVEYVYNSRGFRDQEWPESLEELKNSVWCVGDSFTVGIGQPFAHTWPQILSACAHQRTINVSMDGASNDWIARKVQRIIDVIDPKNIAVMWSYTHRRELDNAQLDDEQRRTYCSSESVKDDYLHWLNLLENLQTGNTKIIHSTIPDFHPTRNLTESTWNDIKDSYWPVCPRNLQELDSLPNYIIDELKNLHNCYTEFKKLVEFNNKVDVVDCNKNIIYIKKRLDWARDYHHFDVLTAEWVVGQMCRQVSE